MHDGIDTTGALSSQWVRRWRATLAVAAVASFLVSCAAAPVGPVATVGALKTPEITASTESAKFESEANFAKYLVTLEPKQKAVRESLNPDKLATMNNTQLSEAFAIPTSEVFGSNERIDPKLYAEAFAARLEAKNMAGCSATEYNKWGGLNATGPGMWDSIINAYITPTSTAFLGYTPIKDSILTTLANCSSVDSIMADPAVDRKPSARYRVRVLPELDSVKVVVKPDGTINSLSFNTRGTDNWETEAMRMAISINKEPTDLVEPWVITDLHVDQNGNVLPTKIQSPSAGQN